MGCLGGYRLRGYRGDGPYRNPLLRTRQAGDRRRGDGQDQEPSYRGGEGLRLAYTPKVGIRLNFSGSCGRVGLSLSALYNRIYVLSLAAGAFGDAFLALNVAQTGIEGLPRIDGVAGGDRWCARRDGRVPQAPPGSSGGVSVGGPARDKN